MRLFTRPSVCLSVSRVVLVCPCDVITQSLDRIYTGSLLSGGSDRREAKAIETRLRRNILGITNTEKDDSSSDDSDSSFHMYGDADPTGSSEDSGDDVPAAEHQRQLERGFEQSKSTPGNGCSHPSMGMSTEGGIRQHAHVQSSQCKDAYVASCF